MGPECFGVGGCVERCGLTPADLGDDLTSCFETMRNDLVFVRLARISM